MEKVKHRFGMESSFVYTNRSFTCSISKDLRDMYLNNIYAQNNNFYFGKINDLAMIYSCDSLHFMEVRYCGLDFNKRQSFITSLCNLAIHNKYS